MHNRFLSLGTARPRLLKKYRSRQHSQNPHQCQKVRERPFLILRVLVVIIGENFSEQAVHV